MYIKQHVNTRHHNFSKSFYFMLANELKCQARNPKTEEKQLIFKQRKKNKNNINFISTLYKKTNRTQKD